MFAEIASASASDARAGQIKPKIARPERRKRELRTTRLLLLTLDAPTNLNDTRGHAPSNLFALTEPPVNTSQFPYSARRDGIRSITNASILSMRGMETDGVRHIHPTDEK